MQGRAWIRSGPSVFGYQPGWLWWAAALAVVAVGCWFLTREVEEIQANEQFVEDRVAFHANEQGLDVELVRAVVQAESSGDRLAQSKLGAKGLMQIMPIAHKEVKRRYKIKDGDLFDVDYNLRVGTLYLAYLLERFDGDVTLALAAYHMGPTRVSKRMRKDPGLTPAELVKKHGGPQTRAYVEKVLKQYEAR